jgi:hypothetical protein
MGACVLQANEDLPDLQLAVQDAGGATLNTMCIKDMGERMVEVILTTPNINSGGPAMQAVNQVWCHNSPWHAVLSWANLACSTTQHNCVVL